MKSCSRAFTLLELMIVVAIIADVLILAVPSFLRARDSVQNTKFINELRVATAAFEMYAAENSRYPANANQGVVPTGMAAYLQRFDWVGETPIKGRWDWEPAAASPARVGVRFTTTNNDLRMTAIDRMSDNGILTTGGFRRINSRLFLHIIE